MRYIALIVEANDHFIKTINSLVILDKMVLKYREFWSFRKRKTNH